MAFPVFAPGDVLNASDMNAVGLWLVKEQTIGSGVASVAVTGAFSVNYKNYRIIVSGGVGSTAQAINMILGASTASYYSSLGTIQYGADTFGYVRSNNAASWSIGGSYVNGNGLDAMLFSPFETRRTGLIVNGYPDYRTNGASSIGGGGFHDVAASYTGFTISVSGTMTGGTIYVYGFKS
jgi:hypothetical protein